MHHAIAYRRAAILLVLCAALAGIASSDMLHDALIGVLIAVREFIAGYPVAGAAVFVVFAAVSAMFTFVSIAIVVPTAVFAWGAPVSIALLWLGWTLGGVVTYGIGRFLGRRVVAGMTANALERLESHLPVDAPVSLILLLQLALPSEIPGYLLGLARYPFARYLVALALAELPYALATVHLGQSFVEQRSGVILAVGAFIVVLSLGTLQLLRRALGQGARRPRESSLEVT